MTGDVEGSRERPGKISFMISHTYGLHVCDIPNLVLLSGLVYLYRNTFSVSVLCVKTTARVKSKLSEHMARLNAEENDIIF